MASIPAGKEPDDTVVSLANPSLENANDDDTTVKATGSLARTILLLSIFSDSFKKREKGSATVIHKSCPFLNDYGGQPAGERHSN